MKSINILTKDLCMCVMRYLREKERVSEEKYRVECFMLANELFTFFYACVNDLSGRNVARVYQ
jgi:hypothetical protein